jgi:uncharacterized protein (DUF1800 family)
MLRTRIENTPRAADPWAPYVPDEKVPWDLRRVVHLHRRAGFAATWTEIQRDLKDGPKASIDRLLAGRVYGEVTPADFARAADLLGTAAGDSGDPMRLRAWWVYRMLFGPDPLGERLILLWHNHFATSNLKVDDLAAMRRQNELFRKYARAPFSELLGAVLRDPALLVWLDAPANRKGHPNENLARELMELFTLGIGHYTETDVKEAARALTGWSIKDDAFAEVGATHDPGDKTILGKKGRWKAPDLARILLEHPATAHRIAFRICQLLLGEQALPVADLDALAEGLRRRDLDVGWAVETVLRSRLFFADDQIGNRVLAPVEYVVGAARALELFEPPANTLILAEWVTRLGQELFYPPNVGGWPGGRAWLTSRSLIARVNFATNIVSGQRGGRAEPLDALGLARRRGQGRDRESVIGFFSRLLLGREPSPAWRERLLVSLDSTAQEEAEIARRIVSRILAMPEAQLG